MNRLLIWFFFAMQLLLVARSAAAADPTKLECVAANDLGQSLRNAGKLHDSRDALSLCASRSCPAIVRDDCIDRLRNVDAVMPSLVFEIKDVDGIDVGAAKITMDGRSLTSPIVASLPVDPGEHHILFEDGSARTEETVIVHEGEKDRRVRVVLDNHHGSGTRPPIATGPALPRDTYGMPRATPSIVAFSVAGAGLVLGTLFSVEGATAKSQANSACGPSGNQCPGDAGSRDTTIRTDTALAVTGFGIAAAGAVAGALLLPHAQPTAARDRRQIVPVLGIGYAGISGRF